MFVPRDMTCQSSMLVSCTSDPAQSGNGTTPQIYAESGAQRYIGVGMVVGALFLLLVLWLWISRSHWRRWRQKRPDSKGENMLVDLSAKAHLEKPKRVHIKDPKGDSGEQQDGIHSKSEQASRLQHLEPSAKLRG